MYHFIFILFCVATNIIAGILIKLSVIPPQKFPSLDDIPSALMNYYFWLGLMFYGLSFLLYTKSLVFLPISIAYPILTSLTLIGISIISAIYFKEAFDWIKIVGLLQIILGIFLVAK